MTRAAAGEQSDEASDVPISASARGQRKWFIAGRWQEYAGETRVNVLRIATIGTFYAIELVNYHGLEIGPLHVPVGVDQRFHLVVTALATAWAMLALGTLLLLRMQIFPPALKYATTVGDLLLLTTTLMVADGPRSPLVVAYFLVIAASALRFQLALVWCTTLGSIVGYLALLAHARWFADGRDLSVPRYQQLIFVAALVLTGVIVGQIVRQARALADDFAARID